MVRRAGYFVLPVILFATVLMYGQTSNSSAPPSSSPLNAQQAQPFDAAVNAYLAKMPPAQRARSDAYFEGGYWLILWDFLSTVVIMWLLLHFRWTARMRNLAECIARLRPLQTALYWIQFIVVTSVLAFPLAVYEGYFREHRYGLVNQNFGQWMRDQSVGLAVSVVLGATSSFRSSGLFGALVLAGGCGARC
jgi:STE24 endopeptidase